MVGKKDNGSSPPALPGAKAPSSMQRSITLDMPFLPSDGGGGTVAIGDSGHGEGSSYYARDGASSIHGETVRQLERIHKLRWRPQKRAERRQRSGGLHKWTGYFDKIGMSAQRFFLTSSLSTTKKPKPKTLISPGRPPPRHHRAPVLRVRRGRQAHQSHRQRLEIKGTVENEVFFFLHILLFCFSSSFPPSSTSHASPHPRPPFPPPLPPPHPPTFRSPNPPAATTTRGPRSTSPPPRAATR